MQTTQLTRLIMITLASSSLVYCANQPKRAGVEPEWYGRMHKLSEAHRTLMPLVASNMRFADPKNRDEIERNLKLLTETATEVASDPKAPDADPLITYSAKSFAEETRQAYAAFNSSDYQWARFSLNRTGDYCISCHTRADRGTRDFPISWKSQISTYSPSQQVEFYLANRQYARALTDIRSFIASSSEANQDPQAWLATIKNVMMMLVRVEGNSKEAESLTNLALQNNGVPFFIRSDLREWLIDIHAWKREAKPKTDVQKLRLAKRLLEKSQTIRFQNNNGAFIATLRASGYLHEILEKSNSANYDEALFLSGIASEALKELSLAQYYFETCITTVPHTLQSERCYSRLEASVHSANPYLSADREGTYTLRMRLADLRNLAENSPQERRMHKSPRHEVIEKDNKSGH